MGDPVSIKKGTYDKIDLDKKKSVRDQITEAINNGCTNPAEIMKQIHNGDFYKAEIIKALEGRRYIHANDSIKEKVWTPPTHNDTDNDAEYTIKEWTISCLKLPIHEKIYQTKRKHIWIEGLTNMGKQR